MGKINTFTKNQIDPCNPHEDEIIIEDIAHALSLLCRSGGHFPSFYSVGQHCISCMKEAKARGLSKRIQLACLLHDASEAYIADITRPVKQKLSEYLVYETRLQNMIYQKYLGSSLSEEETKLVSEIDDAMLYHEFMHFMGIGLFDIVPEIKTSPDYEFFGFREIEEEYLEMFAELK